MRMGLTKSCGCLNRDNIIARSTIHGAAKRGLNTPEFTAWMGMINRCTNPGSTDFQNYGGRGIKVCDRWRNNFSAFLADLGQKPSGRHSLDRVDTNGNYEPENCRWATPSEQARNRRSNRLLTHGGHTACVAEWSEISGIHSHDIRNRLRRGWSVERTLTTR